MISYPASLKDLIFLNSVVFLEWFENQLMPALKNPSLVVLDNASYHNVKTEDTVCPNFSQKKAFIG
jgi:transposase